MDIEGIWNQFLTSLTTMDNIKQAVYKKVAGLPFLYVDTESGIELDELEKAIRISAARSMKGKQLHSETIFVRKEHGLYVFRHRFYVPQQKMFCCGNLCPDCIRLRNE